MKKIYLLFIFIIVSFTAQTKNKDSNYKVKYKNSVTYSHSIKIPISQAKSYNFIIEELSKNYILTTKESELPTLNGKDKFKLDTLKDCTEAIEGQFIMHEHVINEIIENVNIIHVSTPSISMLELKNKTIEDHTETYVYWRFKELSAEETEIQIKVIVQFSNNLERHKVLLARTMKPWKRQCKNELEGLKKLMLKNNKKI